MTLLTDLRLGARVLGRHPGLAAAAIVSLALGIGANSAIFSVFHHAVLAELPYSEPDRLMMVWETGQDVRSRWVAPANFVDWRRETRAFESLAAYDAFSPTLVGRGEAEMVVAELALAQVLLVGAGLLVASLLASQRVDLGFASEGRIAATLSLAPDRYLRLREEGSFQIDPGAKTRFVSTVLASLNGLPHVRGAAASFTAPLSGAPNREVRIDGTPEPAPGLEPAADFQLVSPGFFRTLGIPLLQGRVFKDADRADATPVVVVNRTFADRYFPSQDPIGRRVGFGGSAWHQIVGVVGDARYRSVEAPADPSPARAEQRTVALPVLHRLERR